MAERNNLSIYHLGTLIKDSRFQGTVSDEISSKLGAIKLLDSYIKHLEDQSSSLRSLDEKTLAEIGSSKQRAESIIQTKSDLVKTVQGGVGHLKSEVLAYLLVLWLQIQESP